MVDHQCEAAYELTSSVGLASLPLQQNKTQAGVPQQAPWAGAVGGGARVSDQYCMRLLMLLQELDILMQGLKYSCKSWIYSCKNQITLARVETKFAVTLARVQNGIGETVPGSNRLTTVQTR